MRVSWLNLMPRESKGEQKVTSKKNPFFLVPETTEIPGFPSLANVNPNLIPEIICFPEFSIKQ